MNLPFFIISVVLLLVAAYQVWVTVKLARATEYSRTQKVFQLALIWAIPILGAVIVHFILSSSAQPLPSINGAFIQQQENHPDYPALAEHHD